MINNITGNLLPLLKTQENANQASAPVAAADGFAKSLSDAISKVDVQLQDANAKTAALSSGKSDDIHSAIIAMEKADISVKFLMAVRNKLLSAYQEISRMQV